jgi:DhnA family fructose-bisphosphate aldolase class Ia
MAGRLLGEDGQPLVVAVDHGLNSWPCRGREDREAVIGNVTAFGAECGDRVLRYDP